MRMYTGIKSSTKGFRDIKYPLEDKRDQERERVAGFACGGGVIDTLNTKGLRKQFKYVWDKGNRPEGTIQAYKYLMSFSKNELNPDDPASAERALEIAREVMEKQSPGHQWIAVAQKDGRGGCLHVHIVMNSLNMETLKAARGRQTDYRAFRRDVERCMQQHGIEIDAGKSHKKRERKAEKRKEISKEKEGYSWMEDLENRVKIAVAKTTKSSDFEDNLAWQGVGVSRKTKKGWTFVLERCDYEEYVGKKASYDRFESDFRIASLRKRFDENYKNMQSHQKERQEPNVDIFITDEMLGELEH